MGKLFGDRGYLIKESVMKVLFKNGIHLFTKIRSNMQNKLISLFDKAMLAKRGIIESTGDILKNHLYMQHTRHRSIWGFFLHIVTSLIAYQIREKKPSISASLRQNLLAA